MKKWRMMMNNIIHILTKQSFKDKTLTVGNKTLPLVAHCSVFFALRKNKRVLCIIEHKTHKGVECFYATLYNMIEIKEKELENV